KQMAALDTNRLLISRRLVRVVDDNSQSERLRPQSGRRADAPAADNAERPAAQPRRPVGPAALPSARDNAVVAGHQPPSQGQQEKDGVVGHLLGTVVRHVTDNDPLLTRRLDVDAIVTDSTADNDLAARQ